MKITMLGDAGVGKTCMVERYVNNVYKSEVAASKGASFVTKQLRSADGKMELRLLIWDTAGQELFRSLAPLYYKDADAIVLVFDITNASSFESLTYWLNEIKQHSPATTNIIIVGNKSDCIEQAVVEAETARDFAENAHIQFLLASAKDNSNIRELFAAVVDHRYPGIRFLPELEPSSGDPYASTGRRPTEAYRLSAETQKSFIANKATKNNRCVC
jgi:small GTP-binding protein